MRSGDIASDRISDVKLTDESVGRREPSDLTVEDHLAQTGTIVTVECPASSDEFSSWSAWSMCHRPRKTHAAYASRCA